MDEIDLLKGFRDDMPDPSTDAWLRARAAIAAARAESGKTRRRRLAFPWFRPLYAFTLAVVAIISAVAGAFLAKVPVGAGQLALTPVPLTAQTLRAKVENAIQSDADYLVYTQATTVVSNGEVYSNALWDYPWTGVPGSTVQQVGTESIGSSQVSAWYLSFVVPPPDRVRAGSNNECQLTPLGFTVDYTSRSYQAAAPPCVTLPPGVDMLVRALRIIGHPVVDNQKTTELQQVTKSGTFKLWISDVNWLPLQSQTVRNNEWTEEEQYTFLAPNTVNKAKLNLDVPRNFRLVPAQGDAS
jgi:hypothetical protein